MWKYTSVITYVLLFRILLCQERIIAHVYCFGIYFIPTITFYKNNVRMITRTQTLFPYRRNLFQRKVINDYDDDDDDDEISTSTNTIQEDVNVLKHGSAYGSSSDSSSTSSSIGIGSGDIQVSASIELPFSVEIAFNAFQDPIRQPTWSSWLQSVEYVDPINSPNITKWTIRVMKFKFSWNAKHTRVDRDAGIIEWESESGVQNFGKVQFTPSTTGGSTSSTTRIYNNNNNITTLSSTSLSSTSTCTTMCLSMTITTPRIVQRLLGGKRQAIQHLIEEKMLRQTLERFRDVVLENDIPQQQQQQQQSNQQYQQQLDQQQHHHQIQHQNHHQNQHQQQTQTQTH